MKTFLYTLVVGLTLSSCASLQGTNTGQMTVDDDIYYTPGDEKVNDQNEIISENSDVESYQNQSRKVDVEYKKTDTYTEQEEVYGDDQYSDETETVFNEDQGYATEGLSYEDHFNKLNGDDDDFYDGYDDGRWTDNRRYSRYRSNRWNNYDPYYDYGFYNYQRPYRFNRWNRWNP